MVVSFNPRLSTVSIIPGMLTRAPERTESSRGFWASPNRAPIIFSTFFKAAATAFSNPGGNFFPRL
jgi:hypothetical protein